MTYNARQDETSEWLNYLQPEGLVVGPNVLRQHQLTPIRQSPFDTEEARQSLGLPEDARREDDRHFVLADPWGFLETVLGWPARLVAGAPGGPAVPVELSRTVAEHETLLAPDMAVLWNGAAEGDLPTQALVAIHTRMDPDVRNQFGAGEWEASPHQRLERLLRETNVGVGILIARNTLRLIHAPRGETPGWISWPLAALGRVDGRPMLAGLKLLLGRNAFFVGATETRLRPLLKASRESQNEVSEKLSGQVLGALHELMRGIHAAAPDRIEALAENDPHHLYEGLLTCLMRLVFLLYAEDRDLLPSSADTRLKTLWESGYSVKTLYARLLADEALNPDTMEQRRGGWGQLLAVFRLIHDGYPDWIARRGGKLFDPDAFPFLEGRDKGSARDEAQTLPVSDGTILRILHGLMTVDGRGLSGERIRERLSYRSLDVESIGSVYETVMGFTARRAGERMIALRDEKKLPAFVGLESLLAQKPNDRQKWLKDKEAVKLSARQAKGVKEATDEASLLAALDNAIDERASPKKTPISAGTPYLQPTDERRRSGSHYTPRSLTEPIVRHALEPAFERIGVNASPETVLALKVCDPACGSGAFLVEACRQLGARLEQAWDMHPALKPKRIPADEDHALHAKRLVAQKCLFGIDRNPMAVDLASLSLWLATLARDHEFTFLDHAIKSGDSLVGLSIRQIEVANWDESKPTTTLFQGLMRERVQTALLSRQAIRNAEDDVERAMQEARYQIVQRQLEQPRLYGDALVAAFFSSDKPKGRTEARVEVAKAITAPGRSDYDALERIQRRFIAEHGWRPFHWEIEFPEVLEGDNPGFDAIVGNPPFAGKNTISAGSGPRYLPWLQQIHEGAHGNADLVAHFFRRSFDLLRKGGAFGLIATNTIGQGDTRATGLATILKNGGSIFRATKRYQWPNEGAAVVVSIIHVAKGGFSPPPQLGGKQVERISAFLVAGHLDDTPERLTENSGYAFQGSILLGKGFTFDDVASEKGESESISEMKRLADLNPINAERIYPLIGGEEVTTSPMHAFERFAIDFFDRPLGRRDNLPAWTSLTEREQGQLLTFGLVPSDYPNEVAEDWPDLIEILRLRVKPIRDPQTRDALRDRWWQYAEKRPGLYRAIEGKNRVLAIPSKATPHHAFAFLPTGLVYTQNLNIVALDTNAAFCVIQTRIHEVWARFVGTTLEDRLTYVKDDCFETFPFPLGYEADPTLEAAGQAYHDHRAELMVAADEGMTKTYNRFHKEDERGAAILRLRELHDEMDRAVLRAYSWDDLAETLRPEFLTEETEDDHTYQNRYFWPADQRDLVLSRLLTLNAERHAEEVKAGVAPAKGKRGEDEDGSEKD